MSQPPRQGLFVGLLTLDLIYQVERLPNPNEKLVASDYLAVAGGPATNAAIAYRHFNQSATLVSILGHHPLSQHVAADLAAHHITLVDLAPSHPEPPPVSSILVTRATGDRAVVSLNAQRRQAPAQIPAEVADLLPHSHVVLIDGHQMALGAAVAQRASAQGIPVVVDGGSWKPNFNQVLRWADYAICSAQFRPPGCVTAHESVAYLQRLGVPHVAMTQGSEPVRYWYGDRCCDIAVPSVQAVDTLGAGDIFHGVFCHALASALETPRLSDQGLGKEAKTAASQTIAALHQAAQVAAFACTTFGTRQWMSQWMNQWMSQYPRVD